jgi:hypothetical protein
MKEYPRIPEGFVLIRSEELDNMKKAAEEQARKTQECLDYINQLRTTLDVCSIYVTSSYMPLVVSSYRTKLMKDISSVLSKVPSWRQNKS